VPEDDGVVRVQPGRQIVQYEAEHVVGQVVGPVAVGDHLVVGDDEVEEVTLLLEPDAFGEAAEVVTEVQRAGGSLARDDA
jgi:hypothetical protein